MSMVINLVEDHNIYLCEGGPVYNGGVQPTPVIFLTQWKLIGNSEVHGQEIWSCGEYSAVDGKYHILVRPLGGSIADIALDEPLRKVGNVADSIEYANGVATLTRVLASGDMGTFKWEYRYTNTTDIYRMYSANLIGIAKPTPNNSDACNTLCVIYSPKSANAVYTKNKGLSIGQDCSVTVYDPEYNQISSPAAFKVAMDGVELIYELATPTTETVQVPQIQEAESYSCVISQGAKAVSWSSFETD